MIGYLIWLTPKKITIAKLIATATVYNPTKAQCDSTPQITASGRRSKPGIHCALSRVMESITDVEFGDKVFIPGVPSQADDGLWVFADRMNKRFKTPRIDIMMPTGSKVFSKPLTIEIIRTK